MNIALVILLFSLGAGLIIFNKPFARASNTVGVKSGKGAGHDSGRLIGPRIVSVLVGCVMIVIASMELIE